MQTFCAFDLETTGLSPNGSKIIQIGAVRFGPDGRVIDRLRLYVNPGVTTVDPKHPVIPRKVTNITGITDRDVLYARTPDEAVAIFKEFAAGDQLVGHNCNFDLAFLAAVDPTFNGRALLDTFKVAALLLPNQSHRLQQMTQDLGILHVRPHQAWSDAEATRVLFLREVQVARGLDPAQLAVLRQERKAQDPGVMSFFDDVVLRKDVLPLNYVPRARAADAPATQHVHGTDAPAAGAPDAVNSAGESAMPRVRKMLELLPQIDVAGVGALGAYRIEALYRRAGLRSQHPQVSRVRGAQRSLPPAGDGMSVA